jgi:hypothetical protein
MAQGNGLDQVLIQPQKTADSSADFGNQLDMQNPMGDVIVFDQIKNLGLVDIPGIGKGMQYPIRIKGKSLTVSVFGMGFRPPAESVSAEGCRRRQKGRFPVIQDVPDG